jgi:hypothetical protein
MRLHTNTITSRDLYAAAAAAGVRFGRLEEHGSRSRARAWDFTLTGSSPYRPNPGGRWARDDYDPGAHAATWDEWGIFLAHLFDVDPDAHATGNYQSREHFRWCTGGRFDTLTPAGQHHRHRWEYTGESVTGSYAVHECECGAVHRWMTSGRRFEELTLT